MKKIAVVFLFLVSMISACSPVSAPSGDPGLPAATASPQRPDPTGTPATTASPQQTAQTNAPPAQPAGADAIQEAAIQQLSVNLALDPALITVVSDTAVDFSNTCLDVTLPEVMCGEAITPGRIIVLESNGVQYEYHVSADGSIIQPATFALTWKREGGIAGFCDNLVIFRSGEIYASRCTPTADGRTDVVTNLLSEDELQQFTELISRVGKLNIDASDPQGVADRMIVTLLLEGAGDQASLPEEEQQTILEFAQLLHAKIFSLDTYK